MNMIPSYVLWALLGMACYSLMTLFVKFAERAGTASTHMILAVSTTIVAIVAIAIVRRRVARRAVLDEPMTWHKTVGLIAAAAGCS